MVCTGMLESKWQYNGHCKELAITGDRKKVDLSDLDMGEDGFQIVWFVYKVYIVDIP